tara:strand:- start:646 stop:1344 length:699 start_codon:yes stop_codon:yes gene_type:complete
MFFSKLPNLEYTLTRTNFKFTNEDFVLAKNIFRSISIDNSVYATDLFSQVELKEGSRPDQIAEALYGDATYDWVILITNKIIDIKTDWYLGTGEFEKLMSKRYTDFDGVKYYTTIEVKNDLGEVVQPAGMVVNYNPADPDSFKLRYIKSYNPFVEEYENGLTLLVPVSNYEYEAEQNAKRRIIQLLKPEYLESFVTIFTASVNYNIEYSKRRFQTSAKQTLNKASIFNNISL